MLFCLFLSNRIADMILAGIAVALQSRLSPFIVHPELQTDIQPRSIRVLGLPEYYPEYRDTGEGFAAFLGSSIVAKVRFSCPSPCFPTLNSPFHYSSPFLSLLLLVQTLTHCSFNSSHSVIPTVKALCLRGITVKKVHARS